MGRTQVCTVPGGESRAPATQSGWCLDSPRCESPRVTSTTQQQTLCQPMCGVNKTCQPQDDRWQSAMGKDFKCVSTSPGKQPGAAVPPRDADAPATVQHVLVTKLPVRTPQHDWKHTQTGAAKGSSAQQRVWRQQQPLQPYLLTAINQTCGDEDSNPWPCCLVATRAHKQLSWPGAIHAACTSRSQPPACSWSCFQQIRHARTHTHSACPTQGCATGCRHTMHSTTL